MVNDAAQASFNSSTLATYVAYNLPKTPIHLPGGVHIRASTRLVQSIANGGKVVAKYAPYVAGAFVVTDVIVSHQVNAGHLYISAVAGLSMIPGAGLINGGTALSLEGASYLYNGKSVSENMNSSGLTIWLSYCLDTGV